MLLPSVTAIMPTRGRPMMAWSALNSFLLQDYPGRKEIIILDDWMDRSFQTQPADPTGTDVVYELLNRRGTIGEKRNICCSHATGDIILHWDSDDFYAVDRIRQQVVMLIGSGDIDMVGYNSMEFVDLEIKQRYLYTASKNYAIGVSLCYWRQCWERRAFTMENVGEDNTFQQTRRLICFPSGNRIVARIHSDNTSQKRRHAINDRHWTKLDWEEPTTILQNNGELGVLGKSLIPVYNQIHAIG